MTGCADRIPAHMIIERCNQITKARTMPFLTLLILLILNATSLAHELRPPVVTIDFTGSQKVAIEVSANLEAVLAGIGTEHADTDDAPQAEHYRQLRELSDTEMAAHARDGIATFLREVRLSFNREPVELALHSVTVPDDPDTNNARTSTFLLQANLPRGANQMSWRWPEPLGDSILRVRLPEQSELYTAWLRAGEESAPIPFEGMVEPAWGDTVKQYVALGFTHIVPLGVDHILFVLGLFLLSTHWRPLLYQVTAFTLAHTLTLGLSIYGIISLSPSIVEPLIAASIVFVALENVFSAKLHAWRVLIVFVFGLLHGMGFAGVLTELGLPDSQYLAALLSFNVGVELGQLAVIGGAFLLVMPWMRGPNYRRFIVIPASLAIAAVGVWWTVERVFL